MEYPKPIFSLSGKLPNMLSPVFKADFNNQILDNTTRIRRTFFGTCSADRQVFSTSVSLKVQMHGNHYGEIYTMSTYTEQCKLSACWKAGPASEQLRLLKSDCTTQYQGNSFCLYAENPFYGLRLERRMKSFFALTVHLLFV